MTVPERRVSPHRFHRFVRLPQAPFPVRQFPLGYIESSHHTPHRGMYDILHLHRLDHDDGLTDVHYLTDVNRKGDHDPGHGRDNRNGWKNLVVP